MNKNETAKPKKLTLNQETVAGLQNGTSASNLRPTDPPGCRFNP